jgi:CheY-like chemotaxis protein
VVTLRRRSDADEISDDTGERLPDRGWAEIAVADTGVGIPEDKLEKVFDRFYQADGSSTRAVRGTGIGLSLTRELVEPHREYIHVKSKVGEGSTFVVGLPLGKSKHASDQIVEHGPTIVEETERNVRLAAEGPGEADNASATGPTSDPASAPIVLVVENNAELRRYIREYLEKDYRVAEAADGVEALDDAFSSIPDLVITDIMMPRMDGVELCRRLKTDERTSHIPVILLTARASGESKVEALETGADDYIIKPFEAKELLVRVRNLIEIRRALRNEIPREHRAGARGHCRLVE